MKDKVTAGKYMGSVKVGQKGQIVIPKEVRAMFEIAPGDALILLADAEKGMALSKMDVFSEIADAILEGRAKDVYPGASEAERQKQYYCLRLSANQPVASSGKASKRNHWNLVWRIENQDNRWRLKRQTDR